MASITLTVDPTIANRVLDGFAKRNGFSGFLPDGVTPETKVQFLKRIVAGWVKEDIVAQEVFDAQGSAGLTAQADAEANVTIT